MSARIPIPRQRRAAPGRAPAGPFFVPATLRRVLHVVLRCALAAVLLAAAAAKLARRDESRAALAGLLPARRDGAPGARLAAGGAVFPALVAAELLLAAGVAAGLDAAALA